MSGRLRTLSLFLIASLTIAGVVAIGSPAAAGGAPVRYRDVLFPGAPTVQSNVQYGAAAPLVLDVYRPLNDPAPTNRAAIVWIHGGGFAGGKRTSDSMIGFATQFAQRGYVTASIDYRVRPGLVCTYGVGSMPPDCLDAALDAQHDAQAAVRWLRANATTYGVDPARIIVAGNSAGGMTALNVNYNSEDPGASGTPGQPSTVSAGVALAGCAQPPSNIGPGEPPTQLIHGSLDPVMPYQCAVTTRNAAIAAGDHSELFTVQESPPGNHGVTNNPAAQSPRISTFLYNRVIAPGAPVPTVSVADVAVTEGNSSTKNAPFVVSLSAASTSTVTVSYATANGTAGSGDFTAKSGTLTYTPGQTAKTVNVVVKGDTTFEPDEAFALNLSGATGATLGDGTATGTIQNDDAPPAGSSLSITDVTKAEGAKGTTTSFTFKVTLSVARSASTTVRVATADGSAIAGSDYTAKTATVTIPAGGVSKNFTVKVTGNNKAEANETFVVNLSNPTGATIADAQGVGTITNDD